MRSLSIDTSSNLLSLALAENNKIVATYACYMERGQGEALIPAIQNLFNQVQFDISSLNQVFVAVGPGSFTGVRIALATARAIGLSFNIPVRGLTNFEALLPVNAAFPLCVALDSKRGDFYVQIFESFTKKQLPRILSAAEIEALKVPVLTDKSESFQKTSTHLLSAPACPAANMIQLIYNKHIETLPAVPLYLREADVTLSSK